MKKTIINILRIAISLGLLYYLIQIANVQKIINTIQQISLETILFATGAFLLSVVFLTGRWLLLISSYGLKTGFSKLFIFYLIGFFFNNFLPTSIGGDLSRAFYLGQHSGNRSASMGTVFLERLIGVLATLTLAGISLFWLMDYFRTRRIVYLTILLAAFIAIFLAVIMSRRLYRRFSGLLSLITFYDIGDKVSKVFDTLHFYRNKKKVLLGAFFFSLLAQFMLIVMNYILAGSLDMRQVAFGYFVLVVPVTFIFSLMPSINGLGVRDSGYMLLLTRLNISPSYILSLSFLVAAIPMIISLVGGAFFLFYRQKGIETHILSEGEIS